MKQIIIKIFERWEPAFKKERDSGTVVFLWILQNFWEHFFYRTPPDDSLYQVKCFVNKIELQDTPPPNFFTWSFLISCDCLSFLNRRKWKAVFMAIISRAEGSYKSLTKYCGGKKMKNCKLLIRIYRSSIL